MNEVDIIQEIRNLSEEQINNWIEARITSLENGDNSNQLNNIEIKNKNIERKFIPRTKIIKKDDFEMLPFKLDNLEYYNQLVNDIREAEEELITNNNYIMHIVQCTVINYFGLHGVEESRSELFKTKRATKEPLTIKDFEKNLTAMCIERSAMAQNLLTFLGYDSILNYGCTLNENTKEEQPHAYNCIINNGRALLIDFTNPSYLDGQYYVPSCFGIGADQLQEFLNGDIQIEVKHKDYYTKDGEAQEYKTSMMYASKPVEEIQEKYNNETEIIENTETATEQKEETRMTLVQKEKWYQKIVDFFKKLFKRNKTGEQKLLSN